MHAAMFTGEHSVREKDFLRQAEDVQLDTYSHTNGKTVSCDASVRPALLTSEVRSANVETKPPSIWTLFVPVVRRRIQMPGFLEVATLKAISASVSQRKLEPSGTS